MANQDNTLEIIDITLLLGPRRCRECVTEELENSGIEHLYYCDVDVAYENNSTQKMVLIVNLPIEEQLMYCTTKRVNTNRHTLFPVQLPVGRAVDC